MKWSDSIITGEPIRNVCLLRQSPAQDWRQHMEQREQAAYERGRREGEQVLRQQLLEQRSDIVELQRGVLDSLRKAIPQIVQELEHTLVAVAFESAKKIVADLPISAELVEGVIREALSHIEDSTEVTILVHPDDLALLRRQGCPILKDSSESQKFRFNSSTEVSRGGCLLQTRFGLLDARRETKIEQLQQAIDA